MLRNLNAEQARKGMTNEEMGRYLDITQVTYGRKKKTGSFNVVQASKLLALFQCQFDYLFEEDAVGTEAQGGRQDDRA